MKNKIISFLGEVKRKNITQIEVINSCGLHLDYFVNAGFDYGKAMIGNKNSIHQLDISLFGRLRQVYGFFKQNRKDINHIEIYGGGRFGFIYALMAKWFGFKILLVERGMMNEYINKRNRFKFIKFSAYVQYKLADICWYKEFYMKPHLERLNMKNLNFIPNSIGHHEFGKLPQFVDRNIDFLWVNRIIPLRHIDWVIRMAQHKDFLNHKFELYGFLDDSYAVSKRKEILALGLKNVRLYDYSDDAINLFKNSKYFLLPADYVFGNNSLLEAMAFGAVPIITNVHGSDVLIQNNVNGLITENSVDSFAKSVEDVLDISSQEWQTLSSNAVFTIQQHYSLESFKEKLKKLYNNIDKL